MGEPGAKKMDQIVSVTPGDVHIIMIPSPGGPVPTPIPHPCTSIIKDKVAEKVKVMGQPGAVKGSISTHTPPHIPMGPGPFQKPPANKGEIVTASSNVFYEGKEAAMLGDTGKMCADPSDAPVGKVIGTAATVLIGGGGSGSDEARAAAADAAMKAAAAACHLWILMNMPPGTARDQAQRSLCESTGHPVDVATGKMFTAVDLVSFPGRIPLNLKLDYSTARYLERGQFGYGWRLALDQQLYVEEDFIAYRDEFGRFVPFSSVAVGDEVFNASAGLMLSCKELEFEVRNREGRRSIFQVSASSLPKIRQLARIEDDYGNEIKFLYANGRLKHVVDTGGRTLTWEYAYNGTVIEIRLGRGNEDNLVLVQFEYDEYGDLIRVVDAHNKAREFQYHGHLVVKETDRNGFSFYFMYDDKQRCVHTWGDGGIFYRSIFYDQERSVSRVVDSRGHQTTYLANTIGLVERICDHLGNSSTREYSESGQLVLDADGNGNAWKYQYDDQGCLGQILDPEGQATIIQRDTVSRITGIIGSTGIGLLTTYSDGSRRPIKQTTATGDTFRYTWSQHGDLLEVLKNDKPYQRFTYNSSGQITSKTYQGKRTVFFEYDRLGGLCAVIGHDGRRVQFESNVLGRLEKVVLSSGKALDIIYDAEGNFLKLACGSKEIIFGDYYWNVHTKLSGNSCRQPYRYRYDNELALISVVNGRGERHVMDLARNYFPEAHRFPKGTTVYYERDPGGRVTKFRDQEGREICFEHDSLNNVTKRISSTGDTDLFEYGPRKELVKATNSVAEVEFLYSPKGGLRAQECTLKDGNEHGFTLNNEGFICFEEDQPLFKYRYAEGGKFLGLWCCYWKDDIRVESTGLESRIIFPNGVTEVHELSNEGQLIKQQGLLRNNQRAFERVLLYSPEGILVAVEDSIRGRKEFTYDSAYRLARVTGIGGEETDEEYVFDSAENISRGSLEWDCGAGDELVGAIGKRYSYDKCGNRVLTTDVGGSVTKFSYDDQSQLNCVTLPSGNCVEFQYDALGRRVMKQTVEAKTYYIWEVDRLIAEYQDNGSRRYFFYYPRSFFLMGWVEVLNEQVRTFFIHNDAQGRPNEVTDESGKIVWAPLYDSFGKTKRFLVKEVDCPFRSQGQYCDEETGLYYNRYRYFDPETLRYLTPDPLGLDGGLNPYRYCANPIAASDPLGLSDQPCMTQQQIEQIYDNSQALQLLSRAIHETDPARQAIMLKEAERLLAQDHGIVVLDWRTDMTNIHNGRQREPGAPGDRGMVLYEPRIILIGGPAMEPGTERAREMQHEAGAILIADQNPPTPEAMAENPEVWKDSIPKAGSPNGPWATHALDQHGQQAEQPTAPFTRR